MNIVFTENIRTPYFYLLTDAVCKSRSDKGVYFKSKEILLAWKFFLVV